jgi:hypothetical protein
MISAATDRPPAGLAHRGLIVGWAYAARDPAWGGQACFESFQGASAETLTTGEGRPARRHAYGSRLRTVSDVRLIGFAMLTAGPRSEGENHYIIFTQTAAGISTLFSEWQIVKSLGRALRHGR